MIIEGDIPDEIANWIKEQAEEVGDGMVALNTVVIMYDYLDADGESCWNYHVRGNLAVRAVVGLLEVVKMRMLTPLIQTGLEGQEE